MYKLPLKIVPDSPAGKFDGLLHLPGPSLGQSVYSVKVPLASMLGLASALLFLSGASNTFASTWVESSFADFRDGEFRDGGTNL